MNKVRQLEQRYRSLYHSIAATALNENESGTGDVRNEQKRLFAEMQRLLSQGWGNKAPPIEFADIAGATSEYDYFARLHREEEGNRAKIGLGRDELRQLITAERGMYFDRPTTQNRMNLATTLRAALRSLYVYLPIIGMSQQAVLTLAEHQKSYQGAIARLRTPQKDGTSIQDKLEWLERKECHD